MRNAKYEVSKATATAQDVHTYKWTIAPNSHFVHHISYFGHHISYFVLRISYFKLCLYRHEVAQTS